MKRRKRCWAWALCSAVLAGCATQDTQEIPAHAAALALPTHWQQAAAGLGAAQLPQSWQAWAWGNEELHALVQTAQQHNLDVAAAVARVHQASASARMAGAALLPEVAAGLDVGRQGHLPDGGSTGHYGAALSARFEVDFWGRNRAGRDAALALRDASVFDRDTVRLTLTAGVAATWLHAVALRERGDIAALNLRNAERLLALLTVRARAGAATALALAQQRALVASQQRHLASLRQQATEARTALAVLLARPEGVALHTHSLTALALPRLEAGLPSELLLRRPDIAQAEAQLVAAQAQVAVARAAMWPSLTLSASLGTGGDRASRLLAHPVHALAAGLTAPIFQADRLAAGHTLAQARQVELLAHYRATILAAWADVEQALNALAGLEAQATAQGEELTQAEHALALAEARYRAGAESLLALLDAQRTLYAAQDAAVQLRQAQLLAAVALTRALGGGWQSTPDGQT